MGWTKASPPENPWGGLYTDVFSWRYPSESRLAALFDFISRLFAVIPQHRPDMSVAVFFLEVFANILNAERSGQLSGFMQGNDLVSKGGLRLTRDNETVLPYTDIGERRSCRFDDHEVFIRPGRIFQRLAPRKKSAVDIATFFWGLVKTGRDNRVLEKGYVVPPQIPSNFRLSVYLAPRQRQERSHGVLVNHRQPVGPSYMKQKG